MRIATFTLAVTLGMSPLVQAADPQIDNEYFEKKVRPILVAECMKCHGAKKQKGGLRLDSRAALLAGGDTGPAFDAKNPSMSTLIQAIRYDGDIKMPPNGKLKDEHAAILNAWIKGGAPWPRSGDTATRPSAAFDAAARAKLQWSYQPITHPAVPVCRTPAANPIDAFLLAKLEASGLTFAPPADKRVLLRRLTFDLIGLPPTSAEIDAFLNDESPEAYDKVVDRLLASPHYGERWGRHWLDLVRFAETHGHEFDYAIPDAWRYRDYVVRAFNEDVPYDRLLTEHLAGDLVPVPRRNAKDHANESIIGTGFWWLYEAKHSPVDTRADQADRIDNQIDVFGKTFLATTISCARCHDHKFDPIATLDYYALYGVLSSTRYQHAVIDDAAPTIKLLEELKRARAVLAAFQTPRAAEPRTIATSGWRAQATAFERFDAGWRKRWDAEGLAFRPEAGEGFPSSARESRKLIGSLRSPTFVIGNRYLAVRVAGHSAKARVVLNGLQLIQNPIYGGLARSVNHGNELRWLVFDLNMWQGQSAYLELLDEGDGFVAVSEAWFAQTPPPNEKKESVSVPDLQLPASAQKNAAAQAAVASVRAHEAKIPHFRRAPAARDSAGIIEHVFIRGNHKSLGLEAPRAMPGVFDKPAFTGPGSGRLELARALTDPRNPLVARVMVNRIWQHHFGEGIVRSPDNFGKLGQEPTHPALLDWLATEFVARGWSIKAMHRLMVQSHAYRQSSHPTAEQAAKAITADPQNKLLHRAATRRLEAEAIRDAMLLVSGRLDHTREGPGVLPFLTEHQVGRGRPASGPLDGNGRRSIYLQVRRNFINPMFTAFDYPTPFTTIGRRSNSNVPAQALAMMNNPFVLQQADLWAKRVLAEPNRTDEQRITRMYVAAFGRVPSPDEVATAVDFVREMSKSYGQPLKAWIDLAHVLLNDKEFIFLE